MACWPIRRPTPTSTTAPTPPEWLDKALAFKAVCERHGVPLRAAALQFPYAHPVVSCLVAGVRTIAHLDDTIANLAFPIPDALWEELKAEGLLPRGRPHAGPGRRAGTAPMALTVDAHHHFWDTTSGRFDYYWMGDDLAAIKGVRGPDQLRPLLAEHGIDRTVVVQTIPSVEETEVFLATAAATDFVAGVVGWVDLTDPAVAETIARLRARPDGRWLVAIRHQVHDEQDPEWLLRPDVKRGLKAVEEAGLAYDILVRSRELPAALQTVRRVPGQPLRGRPHRQARHQGWRDRALGLAHGAPGGLPQCLGQGLGHDHRGRLGALGTGRPGALRAAPAVVVRPTAASLRLGLAGLHDGRQLRPGRRRGAPGPGRPL